MESSSKNTFPLNLEKVTSHERIYHLGSLWRPLGRKTVKRNPSKASLFLGLHWIVKYMGAGGEPCLYAGTNPLALVAAPSVHRDPFKMLRKWLRLPSQKNKRKAGTLGFQTLTSRSLITLKYKGGFMYVYIYIYLYARPFAICLGPLAILCPAWLFL